MRNAIIAWRPRTRAPCFAGGRAPRHLPDSALPGTELPGGPLTCPPWWSGARLRVTHERRLVRTPPGTQPCTPLPLQVRSRWDPALPAGCGWTQASRLKSPRVGGQHPVCLPCSEAHPSEKRRKKPPGTEQAGDGGQGVSSAAPGQAGLSLQKIPRGHRLSALDGASEREGTGLQTI